MKKRKNSRSSSKNKEKIKEEEKNKKFQLNKFISGIKLLNKVKDKIHQIRENKYKYLEENREKLINENGSKISNKMDSKIKDIKDKYEKIIIKEVKYKISQKEIYFFKKINELRKDYEIALESYNKEIKNISKLSKELKQLGDQIEHLDSMPSHLLSQEDISEVKMGLREVNQVMYDNRVTTFSAIEKGGAHYELERQQRYLSGLLSKHNKSIDNIERSNQKRRHLSSKLDLYKLSERRCEQKKQTLTEKEEDYLVEKQEKDNEWKEKKELIYEKIEKEVRKKYEKELNERLNQTEASLKQKKKDFILALDKKIEKLKNKLNLSNKK
jgi:hypothetical protein